MRRPWFILGALTVWTLTPALWAQQGADPQTQLAQQQKSLQYLRIEYERCRQDVLDIWTKGDAAEQRAKDLEDAVRKLTEELTTLRSKAGEKPSN